MTYVFTSIKIAIFYSFWKSLKQPIKKVKRHFLVRQFRLRLRLYHRRDLFHIRTDLQKDKL